MSAEFVDSNVLLYLVSTDTRKENRAKAILASRPVISVQVLNEIVNVSRRKFRATWPEVHILLTEVRAFASVRSFTLRMHEHGLELIERHRFAVYDAMIVAAALEAGCTTLWSEDMHHGLRVEERLTIRNPFLPTEGSPA